MIIHKQTLNVDKMGNGSDKSGHALNHGVLCSFKIYILWILIGIIKSSYERLNK